MFVSFFLLSSREERCPSGPGSPAGAALRSPKRTPASAQAALRRRPRSHRAFPRATAGPALRPPSASARRPGREERSRAERAGGSGGGRAGPGSAAGERRGRPPPASSPAEAAAPGRRRPRSPVSPVSPVSPSSPAPPPPRSPHPTPPAPAPGEGAVGSRPPTQRPLFPAASPEVTRQGAAAAPHGHGERRRTRGAGGAQR